MTEIYTKPRPPAETAFGDLQTQFFGKNKAAEELQSESERRDAKTLRLREARLANEMAAQASPTSVDPATQSKTR